jgi:hypothetical protein
MIYLRARLCCDVLLIGMILAAFIGPSWGQEAQQPGRFQIIIRPDVRADTFLLDTETGKVWRLVQFSDLNGEPTVWEPIDRLDGSFDFMALAQKYGAKPKLKPH